MAEPTDWKVGYQRAVQEYVFRHGTPRAPLKAGSDHWQEPFYYGYIADDWREISKHFVTCAPVFGKITEQEWDAFQDTFSGSKTVYGIDMAISCSCGLYVDRVYRLAEPLSKIITGLLTEEG